MSAPVVYRGYRIESDQTPLGVAFQVYRPNSNEMVIGCWSLEDAKRYARLDIKQAKCAHDGARFESKDGKREYCSACDKRLGVRKRSA